MTNIQLTKPAASQTQTVTSTTDARFVLDFDTGDAQLAKSENGENLIITFEDGAKIEVEGFYTAFNKDNLPTLSVNGQDITGDQLTAILGEDLMPAAGPAASAAASAGGSNVTFTNLSLDEGIDRVGGLDIGFPDEANLETTIEGVGVLPGQSAGVAAVATVAAAPVVPDTPPAFDFTAVKDTHEVGVMNRVSLTLLDNDGTDVNKGREVSHYEKKDSSFADGMIKEEGGANRTVSLELDADAVEKFVLDGWSNPGLPSDRLNLAAKANNFDAEYTATYEAKGEFGGTASADVLIKIGDNATDLEGATDGSDVAWVATNTGTGTINTGGGSDLIVVKNNKGTIDAGNGADTLYLGDNSGTVNAGAGNDMINVAGTNTGTISAGGGSDTITVNVNKGTIKGSENTGDKAYIDVLEGEAGSAITGGAGSDYVTLRGSTVELQDDDTYKGVTINTGGGDDKVNLRGDDYRQEYSVGDTQAPADGGHWWADATSRDGNGHLVIDNAKLAEIAAKDAHNVTVYGGDGNDTLQTSDATNNNILYGDGGSDKLEAFDLAHNNTLYGGDDADTLLARRWAYDNELHGEDGDDVLIVQEFAHGNTLDGGDGNDLLIVQGLSFSAVSGEGTDGETGAKLTGNAYENELHGGDGADRLYALSGAQNNLLDGGECNDYLYVGGNGYFGSGVSAQAQLGNKAWSNSDYETTGNTLNGGAGNDTLEVGNGAEGNTLNGGAGNDLFIAQNLTVLENNDFHGGEGTDVLVAQGLSLDGALLRSLLEAGDVTGMEAIVTKGSVSSVQQLLDKSGVSQNDDGTIAIDGHGWKPGETQTFNVDGGTVGYQEYSNGDLTILVAQSIVNTDTGGGA